ncbi:MAG TPA: hypothetical protein VF143_11205 [Candidatus Nanopelagicales bacterium]
MTIATGQVLTPTDVTNQVNAEGLSVLGLTAPMLSMTWAGATPAAGAVSATTLRMTLSGARAPFTGTYELVAAPTRFSGPSGDPLTTSAGVLALHPEALHRLESLVRTRLGSLDRPVPAAMLVHGVSLPPKPLMSWFRAGDPLPDPGDISFHDRRGLVIDPVAVAALFADLLGFRPALSPVPFAAATVTGPGGVGAIAALAGSVAVRVHVVSPHGAAYRSRRTGSELQVLDAAGSVVAPVPASGLVDLAVGQQLGRAAPIGPTPPPPQVLWGASPGGTLDTVAFTVPTLPAGPTLPRQFFRLVVVDLDWHLLGNRAFAPGDPAVPAEDDLPANTPLPQVRRSLAGFTFLLDGADVVGAMGAALTAWPAAADRIGLLCSPQIDTTLALSAGTGAPVHWPALPGAPTPPVGATAAMMAWDPTAAAGAPTATWATPPPGADPRDVIVTIPAGALPAGTHVRAYGRVFQVIRGIGEDPSFVRADGGAAIVGAAGATALRLPNAFGLASADPLPDPAVVSLDLVLVAPDGTRRMVSALHLPVGPPQPWVDNTATFGGAVSPIVAGLVAGAGFTSIAPSATFGIPQTTPPTPAPAAGASVTTWVRWLSNEGAWPRIGPRLPTQTRFETVLALGAVTTAGAPYAFTAVLSGARYAWESRCASPELGNPGNPAGPDVHATGVSVRGQLAHDLAFHALKRAQSILPTGSAPGWLMQSAGDNWNTPPPDPAPAAGAPYLAGAMLETIAAVTDSPELALLPVPSETDTIQSLVDAITSAFGVAPGTVSGTLANEARLRHQLQREIATARRGQRDAMWSLARAVAEAREYVFVESPMFAATAGAGDASLVDLVDLLETRLTANPNLKVLISVPRLPDFAAAAPPFVRGAFRDRAAAITALQTAAPARVAAFHPIGFPGRSVVGRSTVVLVDDAYALIGTSHWRRRGMTFDGGCDVATIDRRLDDRGACAAIARFRQGLLAVRLGVPVPASAATSTALWTRLAEPESAFDVVRDLLGGGGLGRCTPIYAGPTDTSVIAEATDTIDPNGLAGQSLTTLLGGLVP